MVHIGLSDNGNKVTGYIESSRTAYGCMLFRDGARLLQPLPAASLPEDRPDVQIAAGRSIRWVGPYIFANRSFSITGDAILLLFKYKDCYCTRSRSQAT